jgi:predicted MFS family arabinose efflux permease
MIAAIGGFAIGGLIVPYWGVKGGFYLDGVSFFVSSALIFFIGPKQFSKIKIVQMGREIVEAIQKSVIQEVKEGLTYFIRKKEVGFTGLIMLLLGAAGGSAYVVGIVFIQQILHRTVTLGLGFLIMFLGIGLFLGALVYGRFGQRVSHFKIIFLSLFFSGLMLIIFVLTLVRYPYFSIAAVLSFILGFFVAPIIIAANTIVHNASTEEMMGKTFSSLEIAMHLGFFLFMFISSFLAEKISSVSVLTMVGFAFSLIGISGFFIKQKVRWLN